MINKEAYDFTREFIGLKEITGPKDNRMIEVAHRLCKIEGPKGGEHTDEIPWCSSWVVLAIMCANIRRNPKRAIEMLERRGIELPVIKECFKYAKVDFDTKKDIDTLVPVVPPTWSASSKSWDTWGQSVPFEYATRGDIVRLTRDGGGHVAFLDEDSLGKIMLTLLGGNQSNKVCSSNYYSRTRLVHVRRMNEVIEKPAPMPTIPETKKEEAKPQPAPKTSWVAKLKAFLKKYSV